MFQTEIKEDFFSILTLKHSTPNAKETHVSKGFHLKKHVSTLPQ